MFACLVLRRPCQPTRARDLVHAAAPGGAEGKCGHHRRARRNDDPAPRAGPSARSRDRLKRRSGAQRLFQSPADAIALDCAADAFGHRQPDARRGDGFLSRLLAPARLQREGLGRCAPSARDALKFGPSGDTAERFACGARPAILTQGVKAPFRRRIHRHANGRTAAEAAARGLGGEFLATARAASGEHLAAADRR